MGGCHNQRSHALLSASGSSRWMNCTPSPRLEEQEGEKKSSSYADEGTLAHEFSENEIRFQYGMISEDKYLETFERISKNPFYNPDFVKHCETYINYVVEQFEASKTRSGNKTTIIVEEKVDYSEYVKEGYGTSDVSILDPKILEVIDLKFGKGIFVSPIENTQGMLYGLGSLKNNDWLYDFKTIIITIVQPRLDNISSWSISTEKLIKWAETTLKEKAKKAFSGEGDLNPGDWCKFCKIKHKCPAQRDLALKEAREDFTVDKTVDELKLLTEEEILEAFEKFPIIKDWMDSVSAHILQTAIEGKKWKGYKLVEGKSQRKLIETEDLISKLKSMKVPKKEFLKESLINMTDMEKLLKKRKPALIPLHIIKPEGSPTLVKSTDPREDWNQLHQAQNEFAEDLDPLDDFGDLGDLEDFSDLLSKNFFLKKFFTV